MAGEGSAFEAEAAKTLAAAERALQRAQALQATIQRGETTAAEVETRLRRAVARDRVAGETIGEKKATPAESAARDEQAIKSRTSALREEAKVTQQVTTARQQGASASERAAFQSRYGAYPEIRNLEQQRGLLEDISRIRTRAAVSSRQIGAPLYSQAAVAESIARVRQIGGAAGVPPILPGGGTGRVPPPGGFAALPAPGGGPTRVGSSFEADAAMTQKATAAVAGYREEMSRLIQTQGLASQAMRRHGALTTEFIQAASRGQVTIRELGFQVASTIGKFGGWLFAGAAIFGVAGAMSALGKGALDAFSGVNQVQRVIQHGVDPSSLRKSFRDLSGEFNLPISDVTDSVYQMGKVFHNTDDAIKASRAVLYSVKVGELDVADATRYLIAIVNGFQLPATQMATVFDQINQAQNRFGITITDVEAGLAKAAGQFRQSGGDVTHLIALITTAQKVTGNTGQVIGTAISRAPNFLRQAANQQTLREFGISASTNVQKVIEEAFKVSGKLSGRRLQELSAAIFGPQYGARVGTALLANRDLYDKVLKTVQPDRAAGSAQRELQTALGGVNEQLQKVLITLQRIGSSLAEAGGLDLLFLMVKALNGALTAANSLLETFNKLPSFIRHTLAIALQLALVMRLLQRFQLGEAIGGGATAQPGGVRGALAGVFGEGERGSARRYRAGLFEEQKFLEEQRATVTSRAAQAQFQGEVASEQYLTAQKRIEQLSREGADGTNRMKDALVTQEAAERQMVAARQTVLGLEGQNAVAVQRLTEVNESLAKTRRRFGLPGLNVQGAVDEARRTGAGQFFPALFQRPTTAEPVRLAEEASKATGQAASELSRTAAGVVLPTGTERELQTAQAQGNRAAESASRARGGFARLGGVFNRLLGNFGNLLFAAFAISLAIDEINTITDALASEFDKISTAAAAQDTSAVAGYAAGGNTAQDYISDFFTGSGIFRNFQFFPGGQGGAGIGDIRRQTATFAQAQLTQELAAQNEALRGGKPVPYKDVGQIEKQITRLKDSNRGRGEIQKALNKYDDEIDQSLQARSLGEGTTKKQQAQVQKAQQLLQQARLDNSGNQSLAARIKAITDPKLLESGLEAALALAGSSTTDSGRRAAFTRARIYYEQINSNLAGSHNAEDIQALDQARQKFFQGVEQTVQDELSRALLLARSPSARTQAYTQAYNTLRNQLLTQPRSDLQQQRQQVNQLQERVKQAQQGQRIGDTPGLLGDAANFLGIGDITTQNPDQLKRLRNKLKAQTDNAKAARKFLEESEREYHQIRREIQQQQYEEQAAIRQARTQLATSRTADPLKQARIQLTFLGTEIDRAIKEYGRGSQQVLQLMQQRQEALTQEAQAQLSLIQAQGARREAGINQTLDPIGYARTQISDLQQQLAFMRAHANRFDPAQITQLEAQIVAAQVQLQQTIYEQASQLREAAYDIRVARAQYRGDPVAAARIELQKAQYALQRAQTPLERRQAQAGVLQQRAAVEQAIFQSRLGTIQYEADIDKITTEQEIAQLRNLLHLAHITQDQRRQIRTQIHQLRQQQQQESAGFDLDLGNIKLPTIYEIRRAIRGGVGGANTNIQQTQNNKVTINVRNPGDAKKVGKELDDIINGGATNALRSAGV